MSREPIAVEIAAHSVQSALAAQRGGAHRVELFSNPLEGGVTPSEGLMEVVRERLSIPLHVLVRPRGGDFCYDEAELDAMQRDIAAAKRIGADGVVFGILKPEGSVNVELTRRLVQAARPMSVTFHRAIDICRDILDALQNAIGCGADRVLTSGGVAKAWDGVSILKSMVDRAASQVTVIAAGGIRPQNVRTIVQQTGIREVHAGLRSRVPGPMVFRNEEVSFGSGRSEFERIVVQEKDVRELVEQVQGI
jgi:copper homeostasis protein